MGMKTVGYKIAIILIFAVVAVYITGCVSSRSSEVYSRDQARQAHTVEAGTVESVKEVLIEGTKTPVGAAAGGIAGGVLGSTIGRGSGRALATVGGALLGAAGGAVAEESITSKKGLEIVVKKDSGETIVVVQEADVPIYPGDRVRVLRGNDGTTRVSK